MNGMKEGGECFFDIFFFFLRDSWLQFLAGNEEVFIDTSVFRLQSFASGNFG